jgi:hypothetical protein
MVCTTSDIFYFQATQQHKANLQTQFKETETIFLEQRAALARAEAEEQELKRHLATQEISYLEVKQMAHERKVFALSRYVGWRMF